MKGASFFSPNTNRSIAVGGDGVLAAQMDSPIAFRNLYALYARRLYKSIFGITKNAQDAEDALQDTFLHAYLAIHTFEGKSSIYSWLTRIAINSALTILRRRRIRPEILFDPQPDPQLESQAFQVKDARGETNFHLSRGTSRGRAKREAVQHWSSVIRMEQRRFLCRQMLRS
jgi:RNA polymerase sigma factor (sigma-70 family)